MLFITGSKLALNGFTIIAPLTVAEYGTHLAEDWEGWSQAYEEKTKDQCMG